MKIKKRGDRPRSTDKKEIRKKEKRNEMRNLDKNKEEMFDIERIDGGLSSFGHEKHLSVCFLLRREYIFTVDLESQREWPQKKVCPRGALSLDF